MRQDIFHQVAFIYVPHILYGIKTNDMRIQSMGNLTFYTIERATTDKQYIPRIYMDIVLIGVFTATLWRNIDHRSFQKFQQTLLHALTAYVTRDGRIIALARYLINLIYKDNAPLCRFQVIIGHLQQTTENTLNVLAHVTGFRKHGGVDYREGD